MSEGYTFALTKPHSLLLDKLHTKIIKTVGMEKIYLKSIIELKSLYNAYELLLEFNKKIAIYNTEDEMKKTIQKFLDLGNPIGIIKNNELIAYNNLYCNNQKTLEAYFGNLYVLSEYRRMGIAKQLVMYSIMFAKNKGFKKIILHVAKDNIPAISLYKGIGFEFTGESKKIGCEDTYEMALNI